MKPYFLKPRWMESLVSHEARFGGWGGRGLDGSNQERATTDRAPIKTSLTNSPDENRSNLTHHPKSNPSGRTSGLARDGVDLLERTSRPQFYYAECHVCNLGMFTSIGLCPFCFARKSESGELLPIRERLVFLELPTGNVAWPSMGAIEFFEEFWDARYGGSVSNFGKPQAVVTTSLHNTKTEENAE